MKSNLSIHRQKDAVDTWGTPLHIFKFAENRWGSFQLDAAANENNFLVKNYISEEQDALKTEWNGKNTWLNPPYGRQMPKFIHRALNQVKAGNTDRVVCLIASRTDTKIFQDIIFPFASEIYFIKRRIKFLKNGDDVGSAGNFASVFVVFDQRRLKRNDLVVKYGKAE